MTPHPFLHTSHINVLLLGFIEEPGEVSFGVFSLDNLIVLGSGIHNTHIGGIIDFMNLMHFGGKLFEMVTM